ncbi:MAG: Ig-like domain repeat protein [Streptosporangiaceae bacterium]
MRLNRPPVVVKAASVAALAAAACAMSALPAGAATAAVVKYATTTVVSAPKTGFTHTNITLSATEKGKGGNPTGTVTFWSGTRKLCHGSLKARKTSCVAQFVDPATKTVIAKYSGNAHHKASSGTATIKITNKPTTGGGGPIATTTTLTSPAPTPPNPYSYVNAGDAFTLTATVAPTTGGSVPTGTVSFTVYRDPGVVPPNMECTATLTAADNGKASCNVQTEVGTWGFLLYEAIYTPTAGSEWTTSNSPTDVDYKLVTWDITSTLLTFNPAAATAGDPVTLKADVTDEPLDALSEAAPAKPDLVTFSIGGVAIPGCANVQVTDTEPLGANPDNIATCTYTPAASGTVAITAAYSGDDYALPSSDQENLTVNP